MKKLLIVLIILLLLPILISYILLFNVKEKNYNLESNITIRVKRVEKDKIETLQLEEYLVGVVASEMPSSFAFEALKAQAVAARTYALKRINSPGDYDLTDTTQHQAYQDLSQLKDKWGILYTKNINKIRSAVYQTKGEYLVYDDKIIEALYFSTSNGYTENSNEYWDFTAPYLQMVTSTWDTKISPYSQVVTKMKVQDFLKKLGLKESFIQFGSTKRSSSFRVTEIVINGKTFTGRDVRTLLDLNSTDFDFELKNNEVIITVRGFGHGVGMSQWGAHGMALDGKNYVKILQYYYKGVEIKKSN